MVSSLVSPSVLSPSLLVLLIVSPVNVCASMDAVFVILPPSIAGCVTVYFTSQTRISPGINLVWLVLEVDANFFRNKGYPLSIVNGDPFDVIVSDGGFGASKIVFPVFSTLI